MVTVGTQVLGHVYYTTFSLPVVGEDELCSAFLFELSFHGGLLDVMLYGGLVHEWILDLFCIHNLG